MNMVLNMGLFMKHVIDMMQVYRLVSEVVTQIIKNDATQKILVKNLKNHLSR